MKLTSTLNLRSLLDKLHPPLPQTTRESQRLLLALQSSFKRELDASHPAFATAAKDHGLGANGPAARPGNASARAADGHLRFILQHPLLRVTNQKSRCGSSGPALQAVQIFDAAVVHGKPQGFEKQLSILRHCAKLYMSDKHLETVAEDSRLGPKIASWLLCADGNTVRKLLTCTAIKNIIPVMYRDGQEDTVWEWLRMLYSGDFGGPISESYYDLGSKSWLPPQGRFIYVMIRESLLRGNLAGAVHEYIQAIGHSISFISRSRQVSNDGHGPEQYWSAFHQSAAIITYSILRARHGHGVPLALFDGLIKVLQPWQNCWDVGAQFLSLYHPTNPSSHNLYLSLRAREFVTHGVEKIEEKPYNYRRHILKCLMDGAQLSLEQNKPHEAQFIFDTVEKHFVDLAAQDRLDKRQSPIPSVHDNVGTCDDENFILST